MERKSQRFCVEDLYSSIDIYIYAPAKIYISFELNFIDTKFTYNNINLF